MPAFSFPPPILGNICAFTINTDDLEGSLSWWQQLGFREVQRLDFPFPWIQVTDGAILIMLRKAPPKYIALTYYSPDVDGVTARVEESGITFAEKMVFGGFLQRHLIKSPDGINITIITYVDGFAAPGGAQMLTMEPKDYGNPEKYVNRVAGMFGEFSHPVKDLEASIVFWEKLGFKALSKYALPYPWSIISDGVSVVGLHQSKQEYPAITYFASDMKSRIAKLAAAGLTTFKEVHGPGSIDVTTPEGQHVFLFGL